MEVSLRFRASCGSTVRIHVTKDTTLGQLKSLLFERSLVKGHFELSLNKKDVLCGEQQSLRELGVVGGDLLYALCACEKKEQAGHPHLSPSCGAKGTLGTSSSSAVKKGYEVEEEEGNTKIADVGGCSKEKKEAEIRETVELNLDARQPCCTEDSNVGLMVADEGGDKIAPAIHLSHLSEFLSGEIRVEKNCCYTDLLCFCLHMMMRDSGYNSCGVVSFTHSSSHLFSYSLPVCPSVTVDMSCFTMGPTLVSHARAVLPGEGTLSCQASFNRANYSNNVTCWRVPGDVLTDTYQLARFFKDQISHRLITDVRRALGLHETGTLTSLLPELKLQVMRYLDVGSLLSLSATCKQLYLLSQDPLVWKSILVRDFGRGMLGGKSDDWKKLYEDRYLSRLKQQRKLLYYRTHVLPHAPPLPHPPPLPRPPPLPHVPPFIPVPEFIPGVRGGEFDRLPPPFLGPRILPHSAPHPQQNKWHTHRHHPLF